MLFYMLRCCIVCFYSINVCKSIQGVCDLFYFIYFCDQLVFLCYEMGFKQQNPNSMYRKYELKLMMAHFVATVQEPMR